MDRNFREPDRAMSLMVDRMLRDLAVLKSRSLLGAPLFAYSGYARPSGPGLGTILQLAAPAGRWMMEIETSPYDPPAAGEIWDAWGGLMHEDGTTYPEAMTVPPHAFLATPGGTTGFIGSTLHSKGWIDASEPFIAYLAVSLRNFTGPDPTYAQPNWYENKIILTPR